MMKEILDSSKTKMQKAVDAFASNLETIRTGTVDLTGGRLFAGPDGPAPAC